MESGVKVIAFALLTAGLTTACHDHDKPAPQEPEIVETKPAATEYYIQGNVLSGGVAKAGVKVTVGTTDYTTNAEGEFEAKLEAVGTYAIKVSETGFLPVETAAVIAEGAANRTTVKVTLTLTEQSAPTTVDPSQMADGETKEVEDNSPSNQNVPGNENEMGQTNPDDVDETTPVAKMSVDVPKESLPDEGANISVTTFVPTPEASTTVPKSEEGKDVAKSTPMAAAHFEPSGLEFKAPVTISIPNPLPNLKLRAEDTNLTYLDPVSNKWVVQKETVLAEGAVYTAKVSHFSAYAINVKTLLNVSAETVSESEMLGYKMVDNSEKPEAVRDVALEYTEKSGWEYTNKDLAGIVSAKLPGADAKTINAVVELLKKQMYLQMGSASGVTSTARLYNTVGVSGYRLMTYTCFPKLRTYTMTLNVVYNGATVEIKVQAKHYTGVQNNVREQVFTPGHSGGSGGSV
jgi:hypothetical protein